MPVIKSLTSDKKTAEQLFQNAIVINGHGSKTKKFFTLKEHILITPNDLKKPYILSVQPSYSMEKDLHSGLLKTVKGGQWTAYDPHSPQVPDVKIGPWQPDEANIFAKNILFNQKLWSDVDGHKGYYLKVDPQAKLVIKKEGQYHSLSGQEAKNAFEKLSMCTYNYAKAGTPIFFYAPKVGKVKVLDQTSLSEILTQIQKMDSGKLVVLATCNAEGKNSPVVELQDKALKSWLKTGANV